ncbi:MAG TPA: ABC-three component system protein [Thermoanaerobaculia bacterium]|jgi:hypothetical protein|nr:ABC-three component system protein [Thermoanaerobaculia bacterium]
MEPLEQAFYEAKFENAYLRAKGDAFQTFFEDLMTRAYKADFMACRPWGNRGDRKNDGFLKSERCLFQVYAPNEMTEAAAIKKIREDFEGAKVHWRVYFDKWVFAHNAVDGLPPHVQAEILEFERKNEGLTLMPWGLEELREVLRRVPRVDLESWFGFAPTAMTKANLGFEDLRVVLETIAVQNVTDERPVKDVPPGKIEANALSPSISILIREGMVKTPLVDDFFGKWHDPNFGERIAKTFRAKYLSFRGQATPARIFHDLQAWAGGAQRGSAEHELAVLTILAYYFERCDIFEEPRSSPL